MKKAQRIYNNDGWVSRSRTKDLRCLKQPLYQLCHRELPVGSECSLPVRRDVSKAVAELNHGRRFSIWNYILMKVEGGWGRVWTFCNGKNDVKMSGHDDQCSDWLAGHMAGFNSCILQRIIHTLLTHLLCKRKDPCYAGQMFEKVRSVQIWRN